ncbi:MAG: helix-turn-helix domain-containing protein [Peptostreptococcus sp.]|uniref:PucR family transcriptional regulator n=1 Tax=Peptostreptococcus sp. TaxID=1262 RepID=UPI002FC74133
MYYKHLIKKLSDKYNLEKIGKLRDGNIEEIYLLDEGLTNYKSNTLYFGYLSQLGKIDTIPKYCILAKDIKNTDIKNININIKNTDIESENNYLEGVFLIDPNDFFSTFNQAKKDIDSSNGKEFYTDLVKLAKETKDIDRVVNSASSRLGSSIILCDEELKIIAYSESIEVTDDVWKNNIERGYCDYKFISHAQNFIDKMSANQSVEAISMNCYNSKNNKYISNIFLSARHVGYIIMIEEENKITPIHLAMLSDMSRAITEISSTVLQNLFQTNTDCEELLYNLLIGMPVEKALNKINSKGTSKYYMLVSIRTEDKDEIYFKRKLKIDFKKIMPSTQVIYHKAGLVAIYQMNDRIQLEKITIEKIKKLISEENIKVGISNIFYDFNNLPLYYNQAETAIRLSNSISKDEKITKYSSYQFYDLLDGIKDSSKLKDLCHPALEKLRSYDLMNSTLLYKSLKKYLECGHNLQKASEELYIHRNTLSYRLNRISEIGDLNLSDHEECFIILASFKIEKYLGY